MEIKYNIEKDKRKTLAEKIGELAGFDVHYCGVPTCAYEIGFFTLDKDTVLSFPDREDTKIIELVLDGLNEAGYNSAPDTLTISMPKDMLNEEALLNLRRIIANKEQLFKRALDADSLEITESEETIDFPWFTVTEADDAQAYSKFVTMLCEFAKNQKRVNNKTDTSDNEKYSLRCFLLRIGMIGDEYKSARRVLLRRQKGSSAFRHGGANNETSK
ncbi:virulence protein [Ruminococcus sp.]|uniref:virulence protein n=1 Tax=Ruminococcus sp. TaxID=41978 RepID=UPI0025F45973|nr:virulence protein [Ruminococcus sp.]